ncbi:trypsin-like serine peptidase [Corallococcus macrosporus]|uniref:Serine protease n=1 Tax=Myxococcus fulvus (strain ATCC BAA-855 / HW-1) TaxID=483219 RepID=F8CL95_MYXFH|nr:Mpr [Corallococcus macrosporus]AEI65220.1 Mpr [Corallococcus macrosporus]
MNVKRPGGLVSIRTLLCTAALWAGCSEPAGVAEEVELKGRTFDLVEMTPSEAPDVAAAALVESARPFVVDAAGEEGAPLHEWSREELAKALRPTLIHGNGGVYTAREPAWREADALLAGGGRPGAERMVSWVPRPRASPASMSATLSPAVIGSDGRTRVVDTTLQPRRATVRLTVCSGGSCGQCTGSYIGPWTLVTAAHCIRRPDGLTTNRIIFGPAQNGTSLPLGSVDCRNDDANSSNDILIGVPSGYAHGALDSPLDYAVVDTFPCHAAPSMFTGYVIDSGSATYDMFGYPADTCPGAPGPATFQCGMSGSAGINGHRIETEHIDTTGGQSGGPWSRNMGSGVHRVAAMHTGFRSYFDLFKCGFDPCQRNFGRRIDASVDAFIKAISFDF